MNDDDRVKEEWREANPITSGEITTYLEALYMKRMRISDCKNSVIQLVSGFPLWKYAREKIVIEFPEYMVPYLMSKMIQQMEIQTLENL